MKLIILLFLVAQLCGCKTKGVEGSVAKDVSSEQDGDYISYKFDGAERQKLWDMLGTEPIYIAGVFKLICVKSAGVDCRLTARIGGEDSRRFDSIHAYDPPHVRYDGNSGYSVWNTFDLDYRLHSRGERGAPESLWNTCRSRSLSTRIINTKFLEFQCTGSDYGDLRTIDIQIAVKNVPPSPGQDPFRP